MWSKERKEEIAKIMRIFKRGVFTWGNAVQGVKDLCLYDYEIVISNEECEALLYGLFPRCWIGERVNANTVKIVTRYTDELKFYCEYDGIALGEDFVTDDINKALDWLYS